MPLRALKDFFQLEAASSVILLLATLLSLIWVNSPLEVLHQRFIHKSLFIINDGLMTLFFVIVGLELKKGYLNGQLKRFSQIMLPLSSAIGGMLVPALIYYAINYSQPITAKGWAIPVATDIAFALAVLTFFGRQLPQSLKLFLLALAIFDDIGAILIIALFYSNDISFLYLILSGIAVLGLLVCNRCSVQSLIPYVLLGCLLWFFLLYAGIHPTIGGVIFALILPEKDPSSLLVTQVETALHPWVAYLIMPLFALANAGVSFHKISLESFFDPVTVGIVLGLFIGKQIGVMLFAFLTIKLKLAPFPKHTTWRQLYGVALLCGIGFTMSLFLGTLSFESHPMYLAEVRLGVLLGSLFSGILGAFVLYRAGPAHRI